MQPVMVVEGGGGAAITLVQMRQPGKEAHGKHRCASALTIATDIHTE